jgi:hypothetical protein
MKKRGRLIANSFQLSFSVYAIRIVKESQDGLKLNGTHQTLIRMGGVNLLGGKTITVMQASTNPGRQGA